MRINTSITASARDAEGRLYLFGQAGQVLSSRDAGATFQSLDIARILPNQQRRQIVVAQGLNGAPAAADRVGVAMAQQAFGL